MHLKNLALLKVAKPGMRKFASVRFAALYDAVTTRVFPGLSGDRMALELNGKDDRLTREDFLALARTIGLPVGKAEAATGETAARVDDAVASLTLPKFAASKATAAAAAAVRKIATTRAGPLRSNR